MSADDFQAKYASVMESMLQSAIAETTKLFETMVNELKAEISRIKKENEDLKARCSQFESSPTVYSGESEKRDTAVQCDIIPVQTILVEQCQSSLQNQNYQSYQDMVHALQEHDYDFRGNSQMALLHIKQESVMKQEEVDSTSVCGQILNEKADSLWASQRGTENEGPFSNPVSSTQEIALHHQHEAIPMVLQPPVLEIYNDLHGCDSQSKELGNLLVSNGAHGEIMASKKHQFSVTQHESEIESIQNEQPPVVSQESNEGKTSIKEHTDDSLQQYADVQSMQEQQAQDTSLNKREAYNEVQANRKVTSQSDLVRPRRGRPPKKGRRPQQLVKDTLKSLSLDIEIEQEVKKSPIARVEEDEHSYTVDIVKRTSKPPQVCPVQPKKSTSIMTPSSPVKANTSLEYMDNSMVGCLDLELVSQQPSINVCRSAVQGPSTGFTFNMPAAESPQASLAQPRECRTSASLQDAMLLVEAMYPSAAENCQNGTAASTETEYALSMGVLQTVDTALAEITTLPHPVETPEVDHNLSVKGISTANKHPVSNIALPFVKNLTTILTESQSQIQHSKTMSVISRQESQSDFLTPQQVSAKSDAPAEVSSSLELSTLVDTLTAVNVVHTVAPKHDSHDNLETLKQAASVSEMENAHSQTYSSFNRSRGITVPPTFKKELSAVVRLTRLPFPISNKESVLVSRLPTSALCDCQSILNIDSTHEQSDILEEPSEPADMFSIDVKENVPLSTENCITFNVLPDGGCMQTSVSSAVPQPVFRESALLFNTNDLSAISSIAVGTTSKEDTLSMTDQDCALSRNDQSVKEKVSARLFNLPSITTQDVPDPHLPMHKNKFLVQKPVPPAFKDQEKGSSNYSAASHAKTCTSERKGLQKESFLAQLKSCIKTHLQTRKTETNPQTETQTVNQETSTIGNDPLNHKTSEAGAVEDQITSLKATDSPTPIPPRRSSLQLEVAEPVRTDSRSCYIRYRRSRTTNESTCGRPLRFSSNRDCLGSKNKHSTDIPRMSSSSKKATSKDTINISSANTTIDGRHTNTKLAFLRLKRTGLIKDAVSPKRAKSGIPKRSGSSKIYGSPKMSSNKLTFFIASSSTFKQNEKESNSLGHSMSAAEHNTCLTNFKSGTGSPNGEPQIQGFKFVKGSNCHQGAEQSTIKKPTIIQADINPKNNLRVGNAKKLVTKVKIKTSNQSPQNKPDTSQLEVVHTSSVPVKKIRSTGVWIPPKMSVIHTPTTENKSTHLSIKKEETSPRSLDCPAVYPPSVSLHPIPVKAPPVVSPLQPLSLIGRRLLKNQCGECGQILSSSAALESHVSHHTGQQPFSCKLCGKRFTESKGLKRHGRVHRNGRIHVCQQCGKGFVYRFGLTKHLQMVHRRIKPFVCQICNKGFFTKLDVESHIRIHTGEKPFHCNLCERKFTRRVELNVHLRWHNGEKRHWCQYCGKGFLDFNNLKRHKYTHTGEKPYPCPHCPKHFTQSGHLKKHVKNVHKIQ